MQKKLYFGSNLKMYKNIQDTVAYLQKLVENTKDISRDEIELFIIPSYTTLESATKNVDRDYGVVQSWMRGDHPKIIMEPIETIRGRSYNNTIILIEEAQQLTFEELKAITTRIGYNTKMILTGDPAQRDTKTTALEDFISIMHKHNISGFGAIKFTSDDIVRSNIVKELIIAFEKEGV